MNSFSSITDHCESCLPSSTLTSSPSLLLSSPSCQPNEHLTKFPLSSESVVSSLPDWMKLGRNYKGYLILNPFMKQNQLIKMKKISIEYF